MEQLQLHLHSSVPRPVGPTVSVDIITVTSISLSWSVPTDQMVTSSEVMWRTSSNGGSNTRVESEGTSGTITATNYTIGELEASTIYNITVSVTNVVGSTDSQPIIVSTGTA